MTCVWDVGLGMRNGGYGVGFAWGGEGGRLGGGGVGWGRGGDVVEK